MEARYLKKNSNVDQSCSLITYRVASDEAAVAGDVERGTGPPA